MIAIAPSILAADFSRLGELVLETERGGANRIHVDVMDGHFVPNLSMGPVVVKGLRPVTKLPLEVCRVKRNRPMETAQVRRAFRDHARIYPEPRMQVRSDLTKMLKRTL